MRRLKQMTVVFCAVLFLIACAKEDNTTESALALQSKQDENLVDQGTLYSDDQNASDGDTGKQSVLKEDIDTEEADADENDASDIVETNEASNLGDETNTLAESNAGNHIASKEHPIIIDIQWDETLLDNQDDIDLSLELTTADGMSAESDVKGEMEVYRNESGEDLVLVNYGLITEPYNHISIQVINSDVDMNICWGTGADNWNNLADCTVNISQDGKQFDSKNANWDRYRCPTGIHVLGICNINKGVYGPYDATWIDEAMDKLGATDW